MENLQAHQCGGQNAACQIGRTALVRNMDPLQILLMSGVVASKEITKKAQPDARKVQEENQRCTQRSELRLPAANNVK
jgi:hypothetical protein